MIQSAVVQQLRQGGVRVTPQRLAIAEAVLNSTDHPTVQQIHERVQQHFPSMTLATVYSTLGVLSKSGLIQELPFAKQSRYESNVAPHVNLVCIGAETSPTPTTAATSSSGCATRFPPRPGSRSCGSGSISTAGAVLACRQMSQPTPPPASRSSP